ncbi:hypothetical protein J3R83DRAFT_6747 [Lanmaoa asiatica]|nr:hypothetical protein J3R83DRAFT_6747 [Lanmaoa asiatica]
MDVWYALIKEGDTFLLISYQYFIDCHEVIWSPSGIALGPVVKPIFQYNPKNCAWIKLEDNFDVGKQMDVCCSSGQTSRYPGTYEWVRDQGTTIIAPETLEYPDRKADVPAETELCFKLHDFPDADDHEQGSSNFSALGFDALHSARLSAKNFETCSIQRNLPRSTVTPTSAITSGKARKRKRDAKLMIRLTENKKYEPNL